MYEGSKLSKMPESKYSVERVSFYGRNDSNLILCIPHYVRQLICYLHIDFRILVQVQSELNWQVSVISFYNNQCFTWTSELLLPCWVRVLTKISFWWWWWRSWGLLIQMNPRTQTEQMCDNCIFLAKNWFLFLIQYLSKHLCSPETPKKGIIFFGSPCTW